MCGIFGYITKKICLFDSIEKMKLYESFDKIKHRGPDRSKFLEVNEFIQMFFGFHRLAIMDESINGDQPFIIKDGNRTVYCLCNGEIFNYKELIKQFDLHPQSNSDCEVLPLIYIKGGFDVLVKSLIGEFTFTIIEVIENNDKNNKEIKGFICRDQFGIRPLFYGSNEGGICFASELKGVMNLMDTITQFPPGKYLQFTLILNKSEETILEEHQFKTYYDYKYPINRINLTDTELFDPKSNYLNNTFKKVVDMFEKCVISKLDSDRPLGALLSGGLDSSLVVAIAAAHLKKQGKRLNTFSIGMSDGTDKRYAEMVAKHCGTIHTHIELKEHDFLNAIKDVIWATETFDITTIRASTGQYLISKWIYENTDIRVLLIGDGIDELAAGYMYFHNAPSAEASHDENIRLLKDIHKYDVLRADRGIAGNGLEARVPFLDYRFVDMYMNIDPRLRYPHKYTDNLEKWLLRKSFDKLRNELLPRSVLFRKKEAFSDGVSSNKRSWYEILQEEINKTISDSYFKKKISMYEHCKPTSKEALYFREKFDDMFGKHSDHLIPYYWLPKWCGNITEPSARVLDAYK